MEQFNEVAFTFNGTIAYIGKRNVRHTDIHGNEKKGIQKDKQMDRQTKMSKKNISSFKAGRDEE